MKNLLLLAVLSFWCCEAVSQETDSVRRTPDRWEPEIAAFGQPDAKHPPARAIVFAGSSSIRFWTDLEKRFPRKTIVRRGFGGSEVSDLLHFADRIIVPYKPVKVFIYSGENDITNGKTAETVLADYRELTEKLRRDLPRCRIYILSLKPSPSRLPFIGEFRRVNAGLKKYLAATPNCTFVDVFTPMLGADGKPRPELYGEDMLHLNKTGYDLWQRLLSKYL